MWKLIFGVAFVLCSDLALSCNEPSDGMRELAREAAERTDRKLGGVSP